MTTPSSAKPLFLNGPAIKRALAELRIMQGTTQASIARALDVNEGRFSLIVNGLLAVKPDFGARLAEHLGVPLDAIVDHPSAAVAPLDLDGDDEE